MPNLNQPINPAGSGAHSLPKAEAPKPEVKTTLDKGVDWVKENTQKGTLVGDHYMAVGAGTVLGGFALVSGVDKLADAVPAVQKGLDFVFKDNGKLLLGAGALGAAYVLGEDAIQSFKEGSSVKAGFETLGAAAAGLGGVELVGRQFDIPYMKQALSATKDFLGDNAMAIGGGVAAVGGLAAVKKGVEEIADGNPLAGTAYAAGGAVGVLGGAELVGRQFNIPVLKEALTGPAKALFTSKGGMIATGGAIGLTGVGTGLDGLRRLTTGKGILNDAIGVAEVSAGITAAAGGTTLVGKAIGNEKLASALQDNLEFVGAAAALGTAASLAKFSYGSMKENGLTLTNTATSVGAGLATLGGVELVGHRLGISAVEKAFTRGWQPVLGVGLGAASFTFGARAVREAKEGNLLNAAGQAGLSFMSGAGSAAVLGDAFNIPVLDKFGNKALSFIGENILEPTFSFVTKNPVLTLGALAVAGGTGAYIYYKNKEDAPEVQPQETAKVNN